MADYDHGMQQIIFEVPQRCTTFCLPFTAWVACIGTQFFCLHLLDTPAQFKTYVKNANKNMQPPLISAFFSVLRWHSTMPSNKKSKISDMQEDPSEN